MSGRRITRLLGALACALAALVVAPVAASAANRYASVDGTGPAASCPQSNPCNIEDAVEAPSVANGDKVIAATGTYLLSSSLDINKAISVGGAPQAVPTIVSGISPQAAVVIDAVGSEFHDVAVVQLGTGGAVDLTRGTVERVLAESNGSNACAVGATGGALSLIRDSVCWSGSTSSGAAGVLTVQAAAGTRTGTLRNVTAWAAGSGGTGIDIDASGGGTATIDALNVIASGTARDIRAQAAAGATAIASLTTSNFADVTTPGAGTSSVTLPSANANQDEPPALDDPDGGDFDQSAGSPTIDAGSTGTLMGTQDLGGEPRIQGPLPDIGADERDGTAPRTTIDSGPAAAVTTGKVTFAFHADESSATFQCRIDDDTYRTCKSPWTSDSLTQGDHVFNVRAIDKAGNVEPMPATRLFSVDKVIAGANVSAPRHLKLTGGNVSIPVTVKADELARVRAAGTVHAGRKQFRFESGQTTLVAGTQHRLILRPTDKKASRKILKAVKQGKKAEAKLTATFTDLLGNTATSGDVLVTIKGGK